MESGTSTYWKGKTPVKSIWPSPEDEISNTFASPLGRPVASPEVRNVLPPFGTLTQGPSPSTSPHMPVGSQLDENRCFSPHSGQPMSKNPNAPTLPSLRDLQLFANDDGAILQPLFPAAGQSAEIEKRQEACQSRPAGQPIQINRRKWKRPPEDSEITRAPWPATKSGAGWYGHNNAFGRVKDTSLDWLAQARDEFDYYNAWNGPGPASQRWADDPLTSRREVLDQENAVSTPLQRAAKKQSKRKLSGDDTDLTKAQPKRQRAARSESVAIDGSPGIELAQTGIKKRKAVTKKAKQPKASSTEPDIDYQLYPSHVPSLSTLDDISHGFHINWNQKPLNLSDSLDRELLHEKEIKLCEKLCLPCARYLYIKRRFFSGYIKVLRQGKVWNINAAQHACIGDDRFGKKGLDVNKIGALFRAFKSVGWHDAVHFQEWVNCDCQHPTCARE
ncbi:hypothetical protein MBLNU459_g3533t1 [Dothideomycetes sp. NU459]